MPLRTDCARDGCGQPRTGKHPLCREHRNEYMREWYAKNRDKVRRKNFIRRGRNVTPEQFDEMLSSQGGVCAICKQPEKARTSTGGTRELCIDHCHESGATRGLLCSACNRGIGMLGDDVNRVQAAAAYLVHYEGMAVAHRSTS